MGLRTETSYSNDAPWDGLGVNVAEAKSVKDILKLAKLNWKVEKRAMIDFEDGTKVDNHFYLRRSTDKSLLDVVGNRYIPTQNEDVFNFFDEFVRAGKARIETAGSLDKGRVVWALAKLGVSFKLPGRDNVEGYLFLGSPHIQGRSLVGRMTAVRDVCNNTLSIALRSGGKGFGDTFRMNHRNEFNSVQQERAKEVLGVAREQFNDFGKTANTLSKTKMTQKEAIKVLQPIFQPKASIKELLEDFDGNANVRMKAIMDANINAPGAQPETAWGVLNAVTYYADHLASRSNDRRLSHAWLGRTAGQKEDVLEALLER